MKEYRKNKKVKKVKEVKKVKVSWIELRKSRIDNRNWLKVEIERMNKRYKINVL